MTSESTQSVAISQKLHEAACRGDGVLWIALDAPNTNSAAFPDELLIAIEHPSSQIVPLLHPNIDPVWRPRWLRADTSTSAGSQLIQCSIDHALRELNSDALRNGQGRCIAGWLTSGSNDISAVLKHVARQMIRSHPAGGQHLVRLHDPAVLWAAWPLLSAAQRKRLLGPIDNWTLLNPDGELVTLAADGDEESSEWSRELWIDIENITPINEMLRNTRGEANPMSATRAHSIATAALRRARLLGFTDFNDLAVFARHAVEKHPHFDDHPIIKRALQARKAEDYYTALIESVSANEWHQVVASAEASGSSQHRHIVD